MRGHSRRSCRRSHDGLRIGRPLFTSPRTDWVITRRAALTGLIAAFSAQDLKAQTKNTLFVSSQNSFLYDPGPGWPDRPERISSILNALEAPEFITLSKREAPTAELKSILRVHTHQLIRLLEQATPKNGFSSLGQDVTLNPYSLSAAMASAGGAIAATDAVMCGKAQNSFVATRPPGHHALSNQAMGFCLFNNVAIAAMHARAIYNVERIAIIDFDVHHGNGIQDFFWGDKNTLYASTHQMPLYPGTGELNETGAFNNIVNAPLRRGDSGEQFQEALKNRILPRLELFAPDLIFICAGFDAHIHDPLGGLRLLEEDFRNVTLRVMEIAQRRCQNRIVSLLEGGYAPQDLARSVATHIKTLMEA